MHCIAFHIISYHIISFHFISFHFVSFRFVSFRFVSFRFVSFHFISFATSSLFLCVSSSKQNHVYSKCQNVRTAMCSTTWISEWQNRELLQVCQPHPRTRQIFRRRFQNHERIALMSRNRLKQGEKEPSHL